MDIIIETPSIAKVTNASIVEVESLKKSLSWTNTDVSFLLRRHNKNQWFKKSNPNGWAARKRELEESVNQTAYWEEDNYIYFRPGSIPYLKIRNINIVNHLKYPEFTPIPWSVQPYFTPHHYQREAADLLKNIKHGSVEMATGVGKTFILMLLTKEIGLNTVIVTPSVSIFEEIYREFSTHLGKKYIGRYGNGKKELNKRITIVTNKSLTMLKPGTPEYNHFHTKQLLLVDEAHTFGAPQLSQTCHGVLSDIPYRFFCSATLTRGSGSKKLLHSIIGETVKKLNIKDAIAQGFLCPLEFHILPVYSNKGNYDDPMKSKRQHFLYNKNIAKIAAKIANASYSDRGESTLILVDETQQIAIIKDYLTVPFGYAHAGGKSEADKWDIHKVDVHEQVEKFNKGEIKVLIGTSTIRTGVNIFPTHNTINWSGGKSEITTKQGPMGRSTRRLEISKYKQYHNPKPKSKIWDFDVLDVELMRKHLTERISFYNETGMDIITHG